MSINGNHNIDNADKVSEKYIDNQFYRYSDKSLLLSFRHQLGILKQVNLPQVIMCGFPSRKLLNKSDIALNQHTYVCYSVYAGDMRTYCRALAAGYIPIMSELHVRARVCKCKLWCCGYGYIREYIFNHGNLAAGQPGHRYKNIEGDMSKHFTEVSIGFTDIMQMCVSLRWYYFSDRYSRVWINMSLFSPIFL